MLIDVGWMITSVIAIVGFTLNGAPWLAISYLGVFLYALGNYVEHKLKGTKYDY